MAGKVIGKTLSLGFRGNVSRTPDIIIEAFGNTDAANIEYGAPVLAYNGGVKAATTVSASDKVVGFAVRHMGQPYSDDAAGYYYKQNDSVDVLVRGSIIVEMDNSTPIAHGQVYVTSTGAITAATSGVAVPNCVFSTGKTEAISGSTNQLVEITVLERGI